VLHEIADLQQHVGHATPSLARASRSASQHALT
jgi:hypothetical protein